MRATLNRPHVRDHRNTERRDRRIARTLKGWQPA
jgi:hypothetical protein